MTRLHLIDGTFELFRAFYSKRPDHIAPDGSPAKATVGVISSLISLLNDPEEAVTHIAVAFDNPVESFRNDLFWGYKTGAGMDERLAAQFDPVEEAVSALGVTVWSMDKWEADDALATGATRYADEVDQVRIMTPDKDLGQCLRGDRVVQIDRIRSKFIDQDALRERRGIEPQSIPDYLALVGDTADGIPGLPGIGEKSAATLLSQYIHLDNIPPDHTDWGKAPRGAARIAQTLRDGREDALLYRHLATLVTDVPLPQTLDELEWTGPPQERFAAWCEKLGVPRFVDRVQR